MTDNDKHVITDNGTTDNNNSWLQTVLSEYNIDNPTHFASSTLSVCFIVHTMYCMIHVKNIVIMLQAKQGLHRYPLSPLHLPTSPLSPFITSYHPSTPSLITLITLSSLPITSL